MNNKKISKKLNDYDEISTLSLICGIGFIITVIVFLFINMPNYKYKTETIIGSFIMSVISLLTFLWSYIKLKKLKKIYPNL